MAAAAATALAEGGRKHFLNLMQIHEIWYAGGAARCLMGGTDVWHWAGSTHSTGPSAEFQPASRSATPKGRLCSIHGSRSVGVDAQTAIPWQRQKVVLPFKVTDISSPLLA